MRPDDPLAEMSDPFDFCYEPWNPPDVEPSHRYFTTSDGVRLHYVDWPANENAPVVVMVHGRRAHGRWFDPVAMELSPNYHCLSLDVRGHGDSENGGPVDLERYAVDLAEFFK